MHDHITRKELFAPHLEDSLDPSDVARNRAQLQRRAEDGLAELLAVGIDQRGSEVLGLPDDARVGHSRELMAHFDGDVFKRPADDLCGDRIDLRRDWFSLRAHAVPLEVSIIMLPDSSMVARDPGNRTVVESCCSITAGPRTTPPTGIRERS